MKRAPAETTGNKLGPYRAYIKTAKGQYFYQGRFLTLHRAMIYLRGLLPDSYEYTLEWNGRREEKTARIPGKTSVYVITFNRRMTSENRNGKEVVA